VLGGLQWLGFVGVLIGPVLVAMLVTLLTLYTEDVTARTVEREGPASG